MTTNKNLLATLILMASAVNAGCGTLYKVDVVAQSEGVETAGLKYIILPANTAIRRTDGDFVKYADQLESMLKGHPLIRVAEEEVNTADIAIYVSYEVSEPWRRFHTVSTPQMEEIIDVGRAPRAAGGSASGGGQSTGSTTERSTVAVPIDPEQALAGYSNSTFPRTIFTKYLRLIAVDLNAYKEMRRANTSAAVVAPEIWSLDLATTGSSDDLSEAIPAMLVSAKPYVGKNHEKTIRVHINSNDRRIEEIRHAN